LLPIVTLLALAPVSTCHEQAELGGTVAAPRVLPVTLTLYDGAVPVATAQADLFGGYSLCAPPGDYWLQVKVGADEVRTERVGLRAGSWRKDVEIEPVVTPPEAIASLQAAPTKSGTVMTRSTSSTARPE
jgi:hypothetical protein